jgi:hypothetical protein
VALDSPPCGNWLFLTLVRDGMWCSFDMQIPQHKQTGLSMSESMFFHPVARNVFDVRVLKSPAPHSTGMLVDV